MDPQAQLASVEEIERMKKTLTREELYALVWSKPMTHLAREFGVSDVALHKHCRKRSVPTPPQGHWAKLAHGKPSAQIALGPDMRPYAGERIVIHTGANADEREAIAAARL